LAPLISIITAVRNGAASLERTIASVLGQTFHDYEYLVIDGGSTDGTADVIRKYEKQMAYWVSEPDSGISDAFNKGVNASHGTVLLFLGSDDTLHDNKVLEHIAERMSSLAKPYFFYGDLDYVYNSGPKRVHQNYSSQKFRKYGCIPHQAMFLDRWFFQKYGLFDVEYKMAMDYEHTARFIKDRQPEYVDIVVSFMRRYGAASSQIGAHDEMDRVRRKYRLDTDFGIAMSRAVLYAKLLVQKTFRLNW
jgi:glycosyltransferase involved in cell wall biosynthesis